jgi:hypothetical protein
MKKKQSILIMTVITLISLAGCIAQSTQFTRVPIGNNSEVAFSTLVPVRDMNKSFVVSLDPFSKNTLKNDAFLYLQIVNKSDQEMWFPIDGGIKIYRYISSTNSWEQVINNANYYGNGHEIDNGELLFPENSKVGMDSGPIVCVPKINNLNQSVMIRIVVLGEIFKDNQRTGVPVGAYVDVKISP